MAKRKMGPQYLAASVLPETLDADQRTASIRFYSGAAVDRYDLVTEERYTLAFSLKKGDIRMDRLNSGAPFLNSHSTYSLADILGVIEKAWFDADGGKASIRFSERSDVEPVWQDIKNGIIRNVSMGALIHKLKDITPKSDDDKKPMKQFLAVDWEPYEISAVPVPADPGAGFLTMNQEERQQAQAALRDVEVEIEDSEPRVLMTLETEAEVLEKRATAQGEKAMDPNTTGSDVRNQTAAEQHASAATLALAMNETDKIRQDAARVEQLRVLEIQKIGKLMNVGQEQVAKLIKDGISLDTARKEILDEVARRTEEPYSPRSRGAVILRDENDGRHEAAVRAMLHRYDPKSWPVKPEDQAREYLSMSLLDIARESLEKKGIWTKGMRKDQIADEALAQGRGSGGAFTAHLAGAMSTSDFPAILADVANKTLRAAYEAAPRTFLPFCRRASASDFKNINRLQLGEAPALEQVNESGEFHYGSLGEMKETYALKTYGKIVAITRQTIVNDDLDSLTRIPSSFGQSAANLESDVVWGIITANAAMADAVTLFHATHKNFQNGSSGIPSTDTVKQLRLLAAKQTGIDGVTLLNIQLRYLIVPAALITDAEKLVTSITPAQTSNVVPEFYRTLVPVAEPRLDTDSAVVWYMAADPAQIDTIEYCYLEGQDGVFLETRQGFNVDGMEIKARLDFAAKAIDWRGLYKTTGAA